MISNQVEVYTGSEEEMEKHLSDSIKLIQSVLPTNSNITIDAPLKYAISETAETFLLINTVLTAVTSFLTLISIKLIYSLLISDIQEKRYEFGMLRSLGFNKTNLVVTLMLQAVSFSLPGVIIGLTISGLFIIAFKVVFF